MASARRRREDGPRVSKPKQLGPHGTGRFPNKQERKAAKKARLLRLVESDPDSLTPQDHRFLSMLAKQERQVAHDRAQRQFRADRPARTAALVQAGYPDPDQWDTSHRREVDFAVLHEVDELRGKAGYSVLRQSFAAYADHVLERAMDLLRANNPLYWQALELRYGEGRTQAEAAAAMGVSARTVRRYETAGRQWLRAWANEVEHGMALRPLPVAQ